MKVMFYVDADESDPYELPDDMTEDELEAEAFDWLDKNVGAHYEILDEDNNE